MSDELPRTPLCEVATLCGGCPNIDERPVRQRARKRAVVLEHFREQGIPPSRTSEPTWDSVQSPLGYRNRIRMSIDHGGQPTFFNREKSSRCTVLEPDLLSALAVLRDLGSAEKNLLQHFLHLELRAADLDGRRALHLAGLREDMASQRAGMSGARRPLPSSFGSLSEALGGALVAAEGVTPESEWPSGRYPLLQGLWFEVPVGGFMQVNHVVHRSLIHTLVKEACESGARELVDLYCGSGNFLLPMARAGLSGIGVERDRRAVDAAARAARAQGLTAHWEATLASFWLQERVRRRAKAKDLVLVDPPRAGLRDALPFLMDWKPPQIAYVSCNPKSLAGDLRVMLDAGYTMRKLRLFDMFPHTEHVEVLAWLER